MVARQVPPAMWAAALWMCVAAATVLSLGFVLFLIDPPADDGPTIALGIGGALMWCTALMVVVTRRAYQRRA